MPEVNYDLFLDCIHCGLCTSACPTYLELGTEMDSPRGRIHLMRGVQDQRLPLSQDVVRHLDLCLDCRACETACPSGVQYGQLIEPFRASLTKADVQGRRQSRLLDWTIRHILPSAKRIRLATFPVRTARRLGLGGIVDGIAKVLPAGLRRLTEMLPLQEVRGPKLPSVLPAIGTRRARVALLTGCAGDALFRHVHWSTARVLQQNGCDVVVPQAENCCGAIHWHAGRSEPAVRSALATVALVDIECVDAIIVNVAGCGAMLKEYHHLPIPAEFVERVEKFRKKVRDITEFVCELGPIAPQGALRIRATYHDACHLAHAQQIRNPPRKLLQLIPELELVPLEESEICCGAAGTYNLTEPELSDQLVRRKIGAIQKTGAKALFVANAGCTLHIARGLKEQGANLWVAHPIEALDLSYRCAKPPRNAF